MAPSIHGPFMVTAPGKVIVFGEHAVVHGKPAIAAAVSLRSYMLVTPTLEAETNPCIQLAFPDIGFDAAWPVDELPWGAFAGSMERMGERMTQLDDACVRKLEPLLEKICPMQDASQKKQMHRSAARCFLYLLLSICDGEPLPPCSFTLRSTLPTGAGLGSSASISVCISTAVLYMTGQLSIPTAKAEHPSDAQHVSDLGSKQHAQATLINNWAYLGEVCIHGTPSGVDNTVATFGKAVHFQKSLQPNVAPTIEPITDFPLLPLMIIDTRQSRSTKAEVEKVAKLMDDFPAVTGPLLDAIAEISAHAYTLIKQRPSPDAHSAQDEVQDNARMVASLGKLFQINHGILASFGVSHPRLERIRRLVDDQKLGYTKLTGGGGGGCAITLVPVGYVEQQSQLGQQGRQGQQDQQGQQGQQGQQDQQPKQQSQEVQSKMEDVKRTLKDEGYAIYPTRLGARGAGIWVPDEGTADGDARLPAPKAFAGVEVGRGIGGTGETRSEWEKCVGDVEDTEGWGWRYWV